MISQEEIGFHLILKKKNILRYIFILDLIVRFYQLDTSHFSWTRSFSLGTELILSMINNFPGKHTKQFCNIFFVSMQ